MKRVGKEKYLNGILQSLSGILTKEKKNIRKTDLVVSARHIFK